MGCENEQDHWVTMNITVALRSYKTLSIAKTTIAGVMASSKDATSSQSWQKHRKTKMNQSPSYGRLRAQAQALFPEIAWKALHA